MTALLLPFFVASLVNSAIPDYSFVALGVVLCVVNRLPQVARHRYRYNSATDV